MTLRSDFGWVIFVAFLFWIFRILQAGARNAGRSRTPPTRLPSGPAEGTQREGIELEELLRQLEGRLGGRAAERAEPRRRVEVKREPPARPVPARPTATRPSPTRPAPADETVVSLEAPVNRAAEAEALEQTRLAAAAARDRELTDVDHAAFEARIKNGIGHPAASLTAVGRLSAQTLRDAVLWQEILGPPKGLQ